MVREIESSFTLRDGTVLFEKTWEPDSPAKAHLIFLHGFSDRSEIHYSLFPTLASSPYSITVHAIDQRGWGKSVRHPSQAGLTGPTSQVLTDIDQYVSHVSTQKINDSKGTPLFIMGHSMGGQQVLHYLLSTSKTLTSQRRLTGAIVEAPYIELDPSSQPSSLLVVVGKLAAMVSPRSQMKQNLDSRYITHDPEVNRAWKEDPLCHDYGTLEGLRDMLARAAELVALSGSSSKGSSLSRLLPVPVFWAHGTADRITAFGPSRRLFNALQYQASGVELPAGVSGMEFKAYEDAFHKIHAEPDGVGISFAKDVGDWISKFVVVKEDNDGGEGQRNVLKDVPSPVGMGLGQGGEKSLKAKL